MKKDKILSGSLNKEQSLSAPTEMMILRPRQELCNLVVNDTIKKHARNFRTQIEELAADPHRWLSIAYPISRVETNSPQARARILNGLVIMCYLNDLEIELNSNVFFDFEQMLPPIDDFFEVTQCPPYLEEYPQILKYKPVFYEPGINKDVLMALIYPKEELVKQLAKMTGLSMNSEVLKYIAQPMLMNGKQDRMTMMKKCTHDYLKSFTFELIGLIISLTLASSEQKFDLPPEDTYAKWTDQLIKTVGERSLLDIVFNSANHVFWLSDPAEFR